MRLCSSNIRVFESKKTDDNLGRRGTAGSGCSTPGIPHHGGVRQGEIPGDGMEAESRGRADSARSRAGVRPAVSPGVADQESRGGGPRRRRRAVAPRRPPRRRFSPADGPPYC